MNSEPKYLQSQRKLRTAKTTALNEMLDYIDLLADSVEYQVARLESAANFMRGMSLDPQIPLHAKQALLARVQSIDAVTESRE